MPPTIPAQIASFVHNSAFPIDSATAVFRDALVHRLHDYSEMEKTTGPVLSGEMHAWVVREIRESKQAAVVRLMEQEDSEYEGMLKMLNGRPNPRIPVLAQEVIQATLDPERRRNLQDAYDRYRRTYGS